MNNKIFVYVSFLLSYITQKLGVIIICLLVSGIGLDIFKTMTYQPQYVASLNAALKLDENTYSQLEAAVSYTHTLEYIFNGQVVKNDIMEKMKVDDLGMVCHVNSQNNTNIITIQVIAPTKKEAYYSLKYLTEWYNKNAENYHLNYELDILEKAQLNDTPLYINSHVDHLKTGFIYSGVLLLVIFSFIVYFKPTIKEPSDIETYIDCRLFAKIPYEKKSRKRKKSKKAILISTLKTSFAYKEAIKKLKNRFEISSQKHHYQCVMMTSSLENEGKSTIAVNLALSLCKSGHKVLLIDGDLRKPSLHKILNLHTKRNINKYLKGEDWQSQIQYLERHDLYVLCAKQDLNDIESLMQKRMPLLIEEAKKEFDYIIIDASPAYGVNDPIIMNEWVDASFLIVKQNEASIHMINETMSRLVQANNNLIGCIYNASIFNFNENNQYYGYRYGYSRYNKNRRG